MKEVRLVQAVCFRDTPFEDATGFDKYFDCKYMGAAEYEMKSVCGELKNPLFLSLNDMTKERDNYDYFTIPAFKDLNNNELIVYCKKEDFEEIKENIKLLSKRKLDLKRSCGFERYLNASKEEFEKYKKSMANFWWDIENNFFFFFGNEKKEIIDNCFEERAPKIEKVSIWNKLKNLFKRKSVA